MEQDGSRVIFDTTQVGGMVALLAEGLIHRRPGLEGVVLVGIRTGGAFLAHRLQGVIKAMTGHELPCGIMDITLYRDDWTRLNGKPRVGRTEMDFSVDGQVVVLVDDVLFTGRTVRAALDALVDLGRPKRIELMVLVDRGQRELPIQPDFVGASLVLEPGEVVDVLLTEGGAPRDRIVGRMR